MRLSVFLLLAAALPNLALAQDGFDAHGFNLSAQDGDTRDTLEVLRAGRFLAGDWGAFGLLEYASAPLVFVAQGSDGSETESTVLDNIFALNAAGTFAVHDHIRLDLSAPLYFTSTGADASLQGAGLGDVRLGALVALVRPEAAEWDAGGGFGLGVAPYVVLPAGSTDSFLGQSRVAGGGRLAGTYELSRVTVSADAGVQFNPSIDLDNLTGSDNLVAGVGLGYLVNQDAAVNLETTLTTPFSPNDVSGTELPAELMLSWRQRVESGASFTLGASTAISQGAGAAQYRIFAGGGFGRVGSDLVVIVDTDGDGLMDPDDACPGEPEVVNGYSDEDGCPDELGVVAVYPRFQESVILGAEMVVEGGDAPVQHISEAALLELDAMPGDAFEAAAVKGACLEGRGTATAVEGRTELIIEMEQRLEARVMFTVEDSRGRAVPGAIVRWQSDDPGCLPKPIAPDDSGNVDTAIGEGTHTALISAEGYATQVKEFTVEQGEEVSIEAILKPTKVRVELEQIVILDKVMFDTNKATIKRESYSLLEEIAGTLMSNPDLGRCEVAGHTDAQGSDTYNLDLSQRRADAVRQHLIDKGVDGDRLIARGFGESQPIQSNNTASGRDANRRVEFNLIDQEAPAE